ncbi:MAG: helix-turn-helix transcriptional regulator [Dyella sp.]|uniref:helix-turn-helix transcriptional regulator n=1 Tax=Dyella sp. TaxID=1869338 RepID=UPI003F7D47F4
MQHQNIPSTGFLRLRQVAGSVAPVSGATIWRWVASGRFPKPVKLSGRVTAWRCEDIHAWLAQQTPESATGSAR